MGESEQEASRILHEAFKLSGLENKEIAHLCGVSVSLVDKWRRVDERGCPSFAQMLRLPASFHLALFRVQNRRHDYARAAVTRLLEAVGDVAVAVGL